MIIMNGYYGVYISKIPFIIRASPSAAAAY
jgi:hypothetical protein